VASTNRLGKVWTVHVLTSKCLQCDSPLVAQGIVCKNVMKVFKMLHLNSRDGSIVRKTSTLHKVTQSGVIPKHNSPKCGFGDNDTRDDDLNDEQHAQNISLEFKVHPKSTINEDVIDVIDKVFFNLRAMTVEFLTLQLHFLLALRVLRGKHQNMLTRGCCELGTPSYHNFIPICNR